ncbi:ABC transporter transmembrane region [Teratosphaeria destructans]|uniref:ABC transporter transmembrane region n=1 Tax=Teratosphaeria destructans TaxID=418781 RepID=A0A9W7W0A1_9PEZI|nr:ABC transporter transmembrane region [Teratosphaeria destructans]
MTLTHAALKALQAFHYATPVAIVVYFLTAKTVGAIFLHQPSRRAGAALRRWLAVLLLVSVVLTVIGEGLSLTAQAIKHSSWAPRQDTIIYSLVSLVAYSSLGLGLLENRNPLWHPYLGAWFVALLLEVPCTALLALADGLGDNDAVSRLTVSTIRCVLLLALCISGSAFALQDRRTSSVKQDETEPLLTNGSTGVNGQANKVTNGTQYGSITGHADSVTAGVNSGDDETDLDSDSEEPEKDAELKAQQRKRLEESGSWFNYMKDFKIFIPMLWPSKNRFVQACLAIVGAIIVAERFLNFLIPRQLGLITDALTDRAGTGEMPWRTVGIWMILSWLQSQAGLSLVKSLCELPVQQFAFKSIGTTAFRHIMSLSMDFHSEKNSGELIRAIEQGQNLQGLLEFMCFEVGPMFLDLIIAFVYVYTLFDLYMSMILLFVGLAYVWIGAKTTTWSVKQRRRFNTAWRQESKVQNEAIHNWQTVSHFNRGAYECDKYGNVIDEFNKSEWYYYLAYYTGGSAQSFIMLFGRLAAISLAVYRVVQGRASVGSFVTLTAYWRSIESPLAQVSWSIRRVSQMLTDSERLLQLMMTKPSIRTDAGAPDIMIKAGEVAFNDVDFAYDPRRQTLKGVTFKAKPGQSIALVGETGGGKSTVLKLLYRYYDVQGGSITIDGQDIRQVSLDSLRDSFGMVPQDPSLFNMSLMENIRYARLDATDEEIREACRAAAIHEKIMTFPDGYKSTVGERGVKLSGGELQRIAIARAILRQPKIVLLDEATSMIDAETESLIQKALKKLMAGRTAFVVAHRLSTIQHADIILVIHDGQIAEHGSHEELIKRNGKYVALWSKQLSKDVKDVGTGLEVGNPDQAR